MKRVRKNGRRWALKVFNIWVILLLLFQPIGTPGMIAIAEELSPAVVEKEAPKEVSKEASKEDPKSEEKVEVEKEAPKVEPKIEKAEPVSIPKEDPKAEVVVPEEKPVEESESVQTDPVIEPLLEDGLAGEITPEAASTEKADDAVIEETPVETISLVTQEVKKEMWVTEGKKSTTNDPVELGEEYKYPGNEDVSVKFTKLPEKPGTLSIEEIELNDKQVEELGALSKIAYDVTSTMENGTFEYALSLPKPKEEKNVQVKYAEKISELDEAKTISSKTISEKDDSVKVTDLDHFTLFIVTIHTGTISFMGWTCNNCQQGNTAATGDYLIMRNSDSYLLSPSMNFEEYENESLVFKARTYGGNISSSNTITISISTDNGLNWSVLGFRIPGNNTMTAQDLFNLSAYNGSEVKIKLETLSASASIGVGVDDIEIKGDEIEIVPDADGDDVPDSQDNCINTPNGLEQENDNQIDDDGDGLGNACDVYNCNYGGVEICGDGLDNNCDGFYDEGCVVAPICGNNEIETGELCDDGNDILGDGCENDCTVTIPTEFCGDGIVNGDEKCDDGNINSSDGCSASCEIEKTGSISGKKFEDCSANGIFDRCEQGMRGWTIFIDKNNDGILDLGETVALTGNGGYYTFANLYPGTYRICEAPKSGWIQTAPGEDGCHEVALNGERLIGYNFGNFKVGTVSGRKFDDFDGNGWKNFNEPYLNDWTIRLYDSAWQKVAETETMGSGWEKGLYSFDNLERGTYYVCEAMSEGWEQTSPKKFWGGVDNLSGMEDEGAKCWKIEDTCSGNIFTRKDFGNHFTPPAPTGKISGVKFEDANNNTTKEMDEALLAGWTIYIDLNNNSQLDVEEPSTVTDANGYYEFGGLPLGNYYVREVSQAGWLQTTPYHNNGAYYVSLNQCHRESANLNFGNRRQQDLEKGSIRICKYNDLNQNGEIDENEPLLHWAMTVVDKDGLDIGETWNTATPAENCLTLEGMDLGEYEIMESVVTGWTRSYPADSNSQTINLNLESRNVTVIFLNYETPTPDEPTLKIEKSNDALAPQAPGTDVLYTIKVTALTNPVLGVQVIDLPPAGFTYRSGTWKAISDLRGDLGNISGLGLTHIYASPGEWSLGDMAVGEVVTLSYVADISSEQDSGTYKDIAWAKGTSQSANQVLANDTEESPFFVGTNVAVIRPIAARVALDERSDTKTKTKTKTVTKVGEVLGAATMLPETGANTAWVVVALMALFLGLALMAFGLRKNKLTKSAEEIINLFIFVLVLGALALSGGEALASVGSLSVQIEQPESPSTNNFQIGFVALDIENRALTLECYKNSDASPFETISLIAGGSSGNCTVDENVAPTDGSYSFYVKVIAGAESKESASVAVDIVVDAPGTPTNYNRDKDGCTNSINFVTANDGGKTVRAEIYRSTETSFTADEATRVANITGLVSNQAVSYSDHAPDCDEKYYYTVRAFNLADEGSGFVGDEKINVKRKTRTETETKTIHPTASAVATTGTGQGANLEGGATGSEAVGGDQAGQVSGVENDQEIAGAQAENAGGAGSLAKNGKFWLLLAIVAGAGLWYYRKKKRPEVEIK